MKRRRAQHSRMPWGGLAAAGLVSGLFLAAWIALRPGPEAPPVAVSALPEVAIEREGAAPAAPPEPPAEGDAPARFVLRGPARPESTARVLDGDEVDGEMEPRRLQGLGQRALAVMLDAPIFSGTGRGRRVLGSLRRGNALEVRRRVPRLKCYEGRKSGRWYELEGGGYVCSARDFRVGRRLPRVDQRQPDTTAILPYVYARVHDRTALRLKALPEPHQLDSLSPSSPLVQERLNGDFLVAMDRVETVGDVRFVRTARGHYVREDDLERFEVPAMRGEHLGENWQLPLAFVYGGDAPLWCLEGTARPCGRAEKHARFAVDAQKRVGDRLLVAAGEFAVEADRVRVARRIARPKGISRSARWIHVELSEQTLVAYEGDTPVFATLVSTGKPGFSTPTGLYRTERKVLTRTMRGRDPVDGVYDVEEVPWVLYYLRGYALHGAYWHDDFGKVRSHGCTNLAPPDARWLFDWASPTLPDGWHATNVGTGVPVYFTKKELVSLETR